MKLKCLWMLLVLSVPAQAFSQQDPTTATVEPRLIVEAVECRGNETIPCDFIRRKLRLPANSEVDGDAVQSAQLRLSALPNFESVRVYLEKGSEKGKALLVIEVVEADALIAELALGGRYIGMDAPFNIDYQIGGAIAGRLSNQNLFGKQKIAELSVGGGYGRNFADYSNIPGGLGPLAQKLEMDINEFTVSGIYIDPNLLGSDRFFASLSASYDNDERNVVGWTNFSDPFGGVYSLEAHSESTTEQMSGALSVGYRLWQYSYVYGRLFYNTAQLEERGYTIGQSPNSSIPSIYHYGFQRELNTNGWLVGYGWDSEDDAYFPTRGLRFSATVGDCTRCQQVDWRLIYKQTWMVGSSSVWTLNVGGEPDAPGDRLRPIQNMNQTGFFGSSRDSINSGGLAVTYGHLLSASESLGGIRRGRWYVKVGTGPFDISQSGLDQGHTGEYLDQAHLTFGLRFENKVFGVIDLFATGSYFWPQ